ncbi:hypothetical protein RDI58_018497 [Solanum bulbocastanum]|uniref:Uncharacterized protein n=1 Tax=Solanum bulbocastanum TaxID=147425 RepID=A0AAN8TH16_SOLBU
MVDRIDLSRKEDHYQCHQSRTNGAISSTEKHRQTFNLSIPSLQKKELLNICINYQKETETHIQVCELSFSNLSKELSEEVNHRIFQVATPLVDANTLPRKFWTTIAYYAI